MKLEATECREERVNFNRLNKGRLLAIKKAEKDELLNKVENSRVARDGYENMLKESSRKFRECKTKEEELKKANRNSHHTIKTYVKHFILVNYKVFVSSYHGGEHEGPSVRRLMKDGDAMFHKIKECALERNNNYTIESEGISSL